MKKGIIVLGVVAAAIFFFSKSEPSTTTQYVSRTASSTLGQSASNSNGSSNDLSEAIGQISGEFKEGVESIIGEGSASLLLDGGNRFAFDCAEDWFLTQLCAESEMAVECLPYEDDFVERRETHQKSEYEELGDYSEYWVGLIATLTDDDGQSLTDAVIITIQLSEDNWGTYFITDVEDTFHIFDLEIGNPILGIYSTKD